MKKEKFYSAAYGLVLLLTLVATSMMGQIAYNADISTFSKMEFEKVESTNLKAARINTQAISTISNHLKTKINEVKNKEAIDAKGTWMVTVLINKEGFIKYTNVSKNDKIGKLITDFIKEIERVEPITYNGVPKEKTVQIPIIFAID